MLQTQSKVTSHIYVSSAPFLASRGSFQPPKNEMTIMQNENHSRQGPSFQWLLLEFVYQSSTVRGKHSQTESASVGLVGWSNLDLTGTSHPSLRRYAMLHSLRYLPWIRKPPTQHTYHDMIIFEIKLDGNLSMGDLFWLLLFPLWSTRSLVIVVVIVIVVGSQWIWFVALKYEQGPWKRAKWSAPTRWYRKMWKMDHLDAVLIGAGRVIEL